MVLYPPLEKKLYVSLRAGHAPLRGLGHAFWERVVGAAGARVISRLSNDSCDAYLLSESSLFVHDDRALLITCGTTPLSAAADAIRVEVPPEHLATLICDVEETNAAAVELGMHELDPAFCAAVARASATAQPALVRRALGFDAVFPGFAIDEHAFQPPGYSLNALRGEHYCAVHVSIEGTRSFASLDTSWTGPGGPIDIVERLLDATRPKRCTFEQQLY